VGRARSAAARKSALAPRKRALAGIDLIPSYQAIETIPYHSKKKKMIIIIK
jgi:hypothetical protein